MFVLLRHTSLDIFADCNKIVSFACVGNTFWRVVMPARYLNIEEKRRPFVANISSMADFVVSNGDEVDAEIIIRDPALSLYCLDDATRRAIFVEMPADLDLAQVPFIYQTQYEHARRLVAMPYETFHHV